MLLGLLLHLNTMYMNRSCSEAVAQWCPMKKMFLEISQNSLENTCARVSLLIKFQAEGFGTPPVVDSVSPSQFP